MLSNTSVESVLSKMPYSNNCVICKGYFPDKTIGLEEERYLFVNIDVDLYKPILAGLEYFWPRMIPGGIYLCMIIFHFLMQESEKQSMNLQRNIILGLYQLVIN